MKTFRAPYVTDPAMRDVVTKIEEAAGRADPFAELQYLHAEPKKVRPGMVVLADGTDWNPGSGAGPYRRSEDNTAWTFIGGGGGGGGTGDVVGPASSVNNRVAFFNGTTGKLIKDSGLTLSGSNTGDQFAAETASTLIGRGSLAGAGAAQEITLGTGLSMSGTTLNSTGGTVTSVAVATLNGFGASVATPTTTAAITIGTSVTGIMKGNGSAASAAVAGTDYVAPTTTVNGHALSANVTVTASDVGLGSVTNDAQTKAAIVPNTAPAAGRILVGNAGGTAYAPVAMSGDVTIDSAGVATIANTDKILANVTLGVAGASLASGTIPARKFLRIEIFISGYAGSDTASLQFNGAAGTAYRYQWATMAAAATTFTAGLTAASTDRIKVAAVNMTNSRRVVAFISNDSTVTEKLVAFRSLSGTGSAATQATRDIGDGAWVSGAATQITSVSLVSTSNMNVGTQMTIYGWN